MAQAPRGSAEPRRPRVHVAHGADEAAGTVDEVRAALTRAGYEPVDLVFPTRSTEDTAARVQDADGVILLLTTRTPMHEAARLLEERVGPRPPLIVLFSEALSLDKDLAGELAGLPAPSGPTFGERINETIAILDTELARPSVVPLQDGPPRLATTRVIDVGVPVTSVAFGAVDGRPLLVAGCWDGAIRLWDLRQDGDPVVLSGHGSRVLSVALGRLDDQDTIVSGGADGTVRTWSPATGQPRLMIEPNAGPVNAVATARFANREVLLAGCSEDLMSVVDLKPITRDNQYEHPDSVTGVALDHDGTKVSACADGNVRVWPERGESLVLAGHRDVVWCVATGGGAVFSGGADGTVRRWDPRTATETHRLDAHAGTVWAVATGVVDGVTTVASGGDDAAVRLWDPHDGTTSRLTGHTGPVRGVAIGTLDGRSVVVSGGDDATIRLWAEAVADQVDWLSDAPSRRDLLHRRPLARAISTRLRQMNDEEPETSFLVHVDGAWGTGKSTLRNFLDTELSDEFVTVPFDAWREAGVGPAWWALLTALRESVRRQRTWPGRLWLLVTESVARLRRVGAPFLLAFVVLLVVAGGILWLFTPVSLTGLQSTAAAATGVLAAAGTVWAGALVASRFLLWDSARGARLFEQSNTNPMLEVTRHFTWLLGKSAKPVVFLVDDLDRCPDKYVVELLDSVQTLVRDSGPPRAHFVVFADGAWIRTSYELHYATFAGVIAEPGQSLGYLFLDKFFQLRIPVPTIDATRQRQYLSELLKVGSPPVAVAEEESRVRRELARSVTETQVVETLRHTTDEVRDRVAGAALERLTTPEAVAATEHSLQRFAVLLPPNPRTMKRFVNTYSAMRAVRTLEGNPVRMASLALWTIIEIRWPSLADHLRSRPESIALVGESDPHEVPENLRPLFADPALRALTAFDKAVPLDADVIRTCCGEQT